MCSCTQRSDREKAAAILESLQYPLCVGLPGCRILPCRRLCGCRGGLVLCRIGLAPARECRAPACEARKRGRGAHWLSRLRSGERRARGGDMKRRRSSSCQQTRHPFARGIRGQGCCCWNRPECAGNWLVKTGWGSDGGGRDRLGHVPACATERWQSWRRKAGGCRDTGIPRTWT